jgi:hypothetical protein
VHDLVDYVVEESRRAGSFTADWLEGRRPRGEIRVKAGSNIRYVNPSRVESGRDNKLYMRSLIVKNDATLEVRLNTKIVRSVKKSHVQPSEMITLSLGAAELEAASMQAEPIMEISIT